MRHTPKRWTATARNPGFDQSRLTYPSQPNEVMQVSATWRVRRGDRVEALLWIYVIARLRKISDSLSSQLCWRLKENTVVEEITQQLGRIDVRFALNNPS